jgi:hypothetical protein
MRKTFQEYYTPTPEEFAVLWSEGTFALDANVLLDVYRFSPATTTQLIEILERLGPRVWIPHQVALEYQRHRNHVSATVFEAYDKAVVKLDNAFRELEEALRKNIESKGFLEAVERSFEQSKKKLMATKAKHTKLVPTERLHHRLTALFDGKVGQSYCTSDLSSKYVDAEARVRDRVPPGYRDSAKPVPDRYGDVLVWFQLLDKAKLDGKPMVLVTGDSKDDWWWEERGKTIGPRPELRREMLSVADVSFYMYSTGRFLENARRYLGSEVTDEAIAEAREVQLHSDKHTFPLAASGTLESGSVSPATLAADTTDLRDAHVAGSLSPYADAIRNRNTITFPASGIADSVRALQAAVSPTFAFADVLGNMQNITGPASEFAQAVRSIQQINDATSEFAQAVRSMQNITGQNSAFADVVRSTQGLFGPGSAYADAFRNIGISAVANAHLAVARPSEERASSPDSTDEPHSHSTENRAEVKQSEEAKSDE